MRRRQLWTPEEEQYLRVHYPNRLTVAIAAHLDRTIGKVCAKAKKLGLAKTAEYIQDPNNRCRLFKDHNLGKQTQFKKGDTPVNKGLRRPGWHSGRMQETQFKKGERSGIAAKNWVPIGTVLPDPEGYLHIKVREAQHGQEPTGFGNTKVWPMYGRYLWEQQNGPIPPKHLVVFKDGDRANCTIENLELRSMADNARRNQMWKRLPEELAQAIQLNGALKRKLRRLSNGKK